MGTHLDAHTQRYLETGDFPAFWLGFDAALRTDVLMARPLSLFIGSHPITPEELLAALESPKAVTTRKAPQTFNEAWGRLSAAWESFCQHLLRGLTEYPLYAVFGLLVLMALVLIAFSLR